MKGSYYVKTRGKKARKYFIEFLEKNGFKIGTDSIFSREEILDSIPKLIYIVLTLCRVVFEDSIFKLINLFLTVLTPLSTAVSLNPGYDLHV